MRAKLAWALMAATVIAASGPALAQERTNTAISDIRQETNQRQTRLTVECTGPLAYTYYSPDPLTLVVDIPEMDASRVPSRISVGSREVESIRVTSMARADGRSLARLEVHLASLAPYQIYSKGKELTLIFDRPASLAKADPPVDAAKPDEPTVFVPSKPRAAAPAPAETKPPAAEPKAPVKAEPLPAPAAEPKVPANAPRATRILAVTSSTDEGRLAVSVKADGRLKHQDFFLGNPSRLVVDFPDVTSATKTRQVDIGTDGVKTARIAQFSTTPSKVARLVLDMDGKAPYRIVERADGLQILFGEGADPAPTALAALRAPEAEASGLEPDPQLLPAPAPMPVMPMPLLPEPQIQPMSSGPLGAQEVGPATGAKKYTGAPISLDFKDGDLQDIFRLFADISGMNVVVNPGVSGKVTLKLNEVPWDQALDLILKANGLGYTLEGNVIRIARLSDLQKEETDRRKLAEEKALAGDLGTLTTRISYAKAQELSDVLKRAGALSARGTINV
ncbi:MAG TPA: AMIN domain-containing protein, partial [Vicinamibacteria bacterium]